MGGERRLTAGLLAGALLLAPLSARPHEPEAGGPPAAPTPSLSANPSPAGIRPAPGFTLLDPPGRPGRPSEVRGRGGLLALLLTPRPPPRPPLPPPEAGP